MTYRYKPPPSDKNVHELIRYICDHGVGIDSRLDLGVEHWTPESLELATEDLGKKISSRTIDSWLSGTATPTPSKLRDLSKVLSPDSGRRDDWLEALLESQRAYKAQSSAAAAVSSIEFEPIHVKNENVTLKSLPSKATVYGRNFVLCLLSIAAALAVVSGPYFQGVSEPAITDLRICDKRNFSDEELVCSRDMTEFPKGTRELFVSFGFKNVAEGARFQRVWFRCGKRIHSFESRNTAPWAGWTWFSTNDFHSQGTFAINVIVGDTIESREFAIGEPGCDLDQLVK